MAALQDTFWHMLTQHIPEHKQYEKSVCVKVIRCFFVLISCPVLIIQGYNEVTDLFFSGFISVCFNFVTCC